MIFRCSAWAAAIAALCFSTASYSQTNPTVYVKQLVPGVELYQSINPAVPLAVTALKVNTKHPGVRASAFVSNDRIRSIGGGRDRETVGSAVTRSGAVAGINGDFFPFTGDPLGLTIVNGRLVSEHWDNRSAVGIKPDGAVMVGTVRIRLTFEFEDGRILTANGVDRPIQNGEVIAYDQFWSTSSGLKEGYAELKMTCNWAELTRVGQVNAIIESVSNPAVDTAIDEHTIVVAAQGNRITELIGSATPRSLVKVRLTMEDEDKRSWIGVTNVVAGGSWLVKGTKIFENGANQGFGPSMVTSRHPRTAAGVTKNGSLLLVVVDGRQVFSRGATLPELARIMLDLGCTDAINLDGGGSSAITVRDVVLNSPSDGVQRAVANGFLVFGPPSTAASFGTLTLQAPQNTVAGSTHKLNLLTASGQPVSTANDIIWGTTNGGAFVDQGGSMLALRTGNRPVAANYFGNTTKTTVTINAAAVNSATAAWDKTTPADSPTRLLNVTIKDRFGNGVPNTPVNVTAVGGQIADSNIKTGTDGTVVVTINWDPGSTVRRASVRAGKASASIDNK